MTLLTYPHPMLTTICVPVEVTDSLELALTRNALEKLEAIMLKNNGMGLAANQVGLPRRFFIMKPKNEDKIIHLINPVWIPVEEGKASLKEGCLSSKDLYEKVPGRYNKVLVRFYDADGFAMDRCFEGIDAVCVQHEVDHLDGIFWIDKLPRDKKRKLKRKL